MQIITKLKILKMWISDAFHGWHEQIWKRDLDERYCCDGKMCGCGGMTLRDIYLQSPKTNLDKKT